MAIQTKNNPAADGFINIISGGKFDDVSVAQLQQAQDTLAKFGPYLQKLIGQAEGMQDSLAKLRSTDIDRNSVSLYLNSLKLYKSAGQLQALTQVVDFAAAPRSKPSRKRREAVGGTVCGF